MASSAAPSNPQYTPQQRANHARVTEGLTNQTNAQVMQAQGDSSLNKRAANKATIASATTAVTTARAGTTEATGTARETKKEENTKKEEHTKDK
jgi:hypothetical protein